jgi:hypothetical protein
MSPSWLLLLALVVPIRAQLTTASQLFAFAGNWGLNGVAEYSCHQHQPLTATTSQYQDWQRAVYCLNTWAFHATLTAGPHTVFDSCYNMSFTVTVTSVSGSTPLAMTWIGIYNTYSNIGVPTVTAELQYTYNYAAGCNQFQELVSLYQATKQYANTIKLSPAASIPLPAPPSYYRAVNTDSNTQKLSSLINLWTQANGWSNYENIQNFCTPPWFGLQCNSAGNVTVISLGNNNLVANMTLWMAQIGGASWTSLLQFSLGSNQLSGNIPATFGQTWTQLQIFQLNNNLFTGSIPPTLGANWGSSILTFSLAQNQFSGSLAAQFGSTWSNIQTISLNNNLLSGSIPFGQTWPNLQSLALSFNLFSGALNAQFGNGWGALSQLYLNSNTALSGTIPAILSSTFLQVWYQNTSMSTNPVPRTPGYQVPSTSWHY